MHRVPGGRHSVGPGAAQPGAGGQADGPAGGQEGGGLPQVPAPLQPQ